MSTYTAIKWAGALAVPVTAAAFCMAWNSYYSEQQTGGVTLVGCVIVAYCMAWLLFTVSLKAISPP